MPHPNSPMDGMTIWTDTSGRPHTLGYYLPYRKNNHALISGGWVPAWEYWLTHWEAEEFMLEGYYGA